MNITGRDHIFTKRKKTDHKGSAVVSTKRGMRVIK